VKESKPMSKIVRPLRGGQITIPAEFRARLGIDQDTLLQVALSEGELRIRPVKVSERAASSAWVKELYHLFAPVRKGMEKYSEEEIDADIKKALAEVRSR
jgi:bifunctional DNA-binding transcriptional regulator/antitoxin component of YhaV-PrlF toxin-antitoxin module